LPLVDQAFQAHPDEADSLLDKYPGVSEDSLNLALSHLMPLVHIFEAVAGDNPLPEIAEVYGLTLQQLIAVLQFAAEGAAPASARR